MRKNILSIFIIVALTFTSCGGDANDNTFENWVFFILLLLCWFKR